MSTADSHGARRWSFANCTFDEADWSLTVEGKRVAIESKPLEILRELLMRPGTLVTKDELLDAIWPDVMVVEASLPTAVHKLRLALQDERRDPHIIETVPRRGYRLAASVDVEQRVSSARAPHPPIAGASPPRTTRLSIYAGTVAILIVIAIAVFASGQPAAKPTPQFTEADVKSALRELDVARVEGMIAAGWSAKSYIGDQHNDALNYVLEMCEWYPTHDRHKMMMMVRTLLEAGDPIDRRNVWGDTAYSIASAPRNCGPDHPVTKMLRRMCGEGSSAPGDRCMASYQLARGQHFVPSPTLHD